MGFHILQQVAVIQLQHNMGRQAVVVGKKGRRTSYAGQVLGCEFPLPKADAYLYIGTGLFHAVGAAIKTEKPVIIADPALNKAVDVEPMRRKVLRQRAAAIERAKSAKAFGILVSKKKGQRRMKLAEGIVDNLRKRKLEAHLITADELAPENLAGIRVDCFISTACPRIAIDDSSSYEKPVLTPQELEIALGEREWEGYELDSF